MVDKNQPPAPNSPGVFVTLNGFVQRRDSSPRRLILDEYKPLTTANPDVGDIIHLLEENHTGQHAICLHQRVVLVICHDKPGKNTVRTLRCVPICYHTGVGKETTHCHWNVEQVRVEDGARVRDKPAVSCIAVRNSHHPHALAVQFINNGHVLPTGITVNLSQTLHVPYEGVRVRDLGQVPQENLGLALKRAVEIFSESVLPAPAPKPVAKKESGIDHKKEKEPARNK